MSDAIAIGWIIAGVAAWIWMLARHEMIDDLPSGILAAMMIVVFAIAGPLGWITVAIAEKDTSQ